jgi:hypothetical protein
MLAPTEHSLEFAQVTDDSSDKDIPEKWASAF